DEELVLGGEPRRQQRVRGDGARGRAGEIEAELLLEARPVDRGGREQMHVVLCRQGLRQRARVPLAAAVRGPVAIEYRALHGNRPSASIAEARPSPAPAGLNMSPVALVGSWVASRARIGAWHGKCSDVWARRESAVAGLARRCKLARYRAG